MRSVVVFSGAVRPEKAEDLARLDREGDLAARWTAAERFAEPVRLDRRQRRRSYLSALPGVLSAMAQTQALR